MGRRQGRIRRKTSPAGDNEKPARKQSKQESIEEAWNRRFGEKTVEKDAYGHEYGQWQTKEIVNDSTGEVQDLKYVVNKEKDHPFPDGTSYGVLTYRDADVYMLENGTVFIQPSDLDPTKQTGNAEFFMERYMQLPEDFRNQIQKKVYVVDYRNPKDEYWAKEYKMEGFRSYATGGTQITFYASNGHDDAYVVHTFAHEGGHYIDLYGPASSRVSESREWKKAMKDDLAESGLRGVSSYAQVHVHEDFAESIGELVTDPEKMKTYFPNRTKILKGIINV